MSGIYVTKGARLSLKNISIRINGDGTADLSPLTVHLRFDTSPTWIKIAKAHLNRASAAKSARERAWSGADQIARAETLELEFEESMQAAVAAATAVEAFYAVLKEYVVLPPDLVEKWRTSRTARYIQVCEVIRRAFKIKPPNAKGLRHNLKEIYRYRDLAVHPAGKDAAPAYHPELKLGMEWRFVAFSATNAEILVPMAANILWQAAHVAKTEDAKLIEYQKALAVQLGGLYPDGAPVPPNSASSSGA